MITICASVYVPTSDALDPLLLPEDLWGLEPERAIALVTDREMIFKRGGALIGDDARRIAGSYNTHFRRLKFHFSGVDIHTRIFLISSHSNYSLHDDARNISVVLVIWRGRHCRVSH